MSCVRCQQDYYTLLFCNLNCAMLCLCCACGQVGGAIKKLTLADITAYEKSGSITVAGHELGPGEIKVGPGGQGCVDNDGRSVCVSGGGHRSVCVGGDGQDSGLCGSVVQVDMPSSQGSTVT
jgi:hypothetical protein